MTKDEMLGAIIAMRIQMGWAEMTPEIEALREQAIIKINAIEAVATATQDMPGIQRLQHELDDVMPWYYRQLAAIKEVQS